MVIDSFRGNYAFLSNFFQADLTYEGIDYPSSECAYQAAKTLDVVERRRLARLSSPGEAKRAGRRLVIRPDWEEVKIRVMIEVVLAKFEQNPDLIDRLLNTGDVHLIEGNQHGDVFWGRCRGRGENWLGRILMEVRTFFRERRGK